MCHGRDDGHGTTAAPEPAGARSLSRLGDQDRRPVAIASWGPCRPSAGTADARMPALPVRALTGSASPGHYRLAAAFVVFVAALVVFLAALVVFRAAFVVSSNTCSAKSRWIFKSSSRNSSTCLVISRAKGTSAGTKSLNVSAHLRPTSRTASSLLRTNSNTSSLVDLALLGAITILSSFLDRRTNPPELKGRRMPATSLLQWLSLIHISEP